jgi:F0F1-type ATP synthase membrane subunit b/b'
MAGTAHADPGARSSSGDAGVKEQAQEKAQEIRDQAGEQARQAAGQARDRVREQLDQRSTDAGQRVSQQASDLREMADQMRQQGKDGPARLAEQAADRTERVGSWLTESDADRILEDVEDFARSNPWAVVAGGLALGFAASRLLKASSRDRYDRMSGGRVPADRRLPTRTSSAPPVDQPLSTLPGAPGSSIPVPPSASPADASPPAVPVDPRGDRP